ncbi:MAG TPA: phosphate ABC transporter substrate-binding protein [Gammaproteobacteria bacterium]|nr:phosphate ABC transporter substrate-binding protein [Gammaproteobacteria bacterium]
MKNVQRVILTLQLLLVSVAVNAEISVIINPGTGVSSADIKIIKKIFLSKKSSIDGVDVIAVDQEEGSAIRDEFYLKVTKKNAAKLKNYWSKMIFSGKAVPPDVVGDDAAVVSWVAKKKNGIGYVNSSAVNGTVKVILTIP